ncbi:MAG TPA: malectin domain-containing carbohydrate-binding protein [Terracidiphilus sp.]|nr:malectin domain-containing carbohydrate-binding protein [Terracidiphilus sp.]
MAVKDLEAISLGEQRAELAAVLASSGFSRAPTLAHLLAWLCEKLFSGATAQIKEYSIGVDVFHRGPEFDQETDSIVRVEVNRLRRRLAEYYQGEGAAHPLRISIPVGQYVPRFECHAVPETAVSGREALDGARPEAPPARLRPASRRIWWSGAAVLVLLLAAGYAWLRVREQKQSQAVEEQVLLTPQPSQNPFGPPAGQEVRILAGSNRSLVDHAGKLWSADAGFTGGLAVRSEAQHIWRTQEQGFYRTSRQGNFRYDIPLARGIYELRLHFAETVFGPESSGSGGEGSRIMDVRANGRSLLEGFDVVADAGASRTADVKVFPDVSPAADGMLHLEFSGENGQPAILSALEILPGIRGRIRPVRVLARQTPYYSNDSHWWSPDVYFEGGQPASYTAPVSGTDDPEMFETERWGHFSYAIPVAPGTYSLTLYFAVRHGEWNEPSPGTIGERPAVAHVFNVFCNGRALLSEFDLPKEAGATDVVVRHFTGLKPSAQGKLLLSFVPVRGYATVTGIEVLPQ